MTTVVRLWAWQDAPVALGLGLEVGEEEAAANGSCTATPRTPLLHGGISPSSAGSSPRPSDSPRRLLMFSVRHQKTRESEEMNGKG